MKIKLSFLLLFLVMHSQNALSIYFFIHSDNPDWLATPTREPRFMGFESNDGSFIHEHTPTSYDRRFDEVIRAVIQDMLRTPVTFPIENLPRSHAFHGQVIINGQTLFYTFTVMQSGFGRYRYDSPPINEYDAVFIMPGTRDVYRIRRYSPEPVGEDTEEGNQNEDGGTVRVTPDESNTTNTSHESELVGLQVDASAAVLLDTRQSSE